MHIILHYFVFIAITCHYKKIFILYVFNILYVFLYVKIDIFDISYFIFKRYFLRYFVLSRQQLWKTVTRATPKLLREWVCDTCGNMLWSITRSLYHADINVTATYIT